MKTLMLRSAALSALALAAADTGSGSGSGQPDDLLKADAAPHPQSSDEAAPESPQSDPAPNAVAPAGAADPTSTDGPAETPPTEAAKAGEPKADKPKVSKAAIQAAAQSGAQAGAKAAASARDPLNKRAYMVWAQPGHETLGLGQVIAVPTAQADVLRGAGRARFASKEEVSAAKAAQEAGNPRAILELDGV